MLRRASILFGAPRMAINLVVKVHYGGLQLPTIIRQLAERLSSARRNLKEAWCKVPAQGTRTSSGYARWCVRSATQIMS